LTYLYRRTTNQIEARKKNARTESKTVPYPRKVAKKTSADRSASATAGRG